MSAMQGGNNQTMYQN